MNSIYKSIENKADIIAFSLFIFYTLWRILLIFITPEGKTTEYGPSLGWGITYEIIAIFGGIWGLVVSKYWGGIKSLMGRSILAFSCGLFMQAFGQAVYSIYVIKGIETPYPSLGDIGFFGSIPFYIYGAILLAKISGIRMKSFWNWLQVLSIPIVMLAISYYFFIRGHEYNWSNPLTVFLDFGYPFGQAIYVSIALLTFVLSRKILGGIMRGPTLFILLALVVQYLSDYTFLYLATRGLWQPGGFNDYMYMFSYFLMCFALIRLGTAFKRIQES